MLTSASGRCSGAACRRRAACRGRTSSCRAGSCRATSARDTCPSRPELPCPAALAAVRRTHARRSRPVSSLFQSAKRIERSVFTSGLLKTRASSITSAVPEPSSFAASPQPMPSMCAADDVHLVGVRRADLGAVDFLPLGPASSARVFERAKLGVGLLQRIVVDAGARANAAQCGRRRTPHRRHGRAPAPPRPPARAACRSAGAVYIVRDALRVRAAVALELRFDPVDRGAIALGALAAIAELRQSLDRRLVLLEVEPADQLANRIIDRIGARRTLRLGLGVARAGMLIDALATNAAAKYDFECMMNSLWLEWETDRGTGHRHRQDHL